MKTILLLIASVASALALDPPNPNDVLRDQNARLANEQINRKLDDLRAGQSATGVGAIGVSPEKYNLLVEKFNALLSKYDKLAADFDALFASQIKKSEKRVREAFPCVEEENHPIHKKAADILSSLENSKDPKTQECDLSWTLYSQAAAELGIVQQSK
jgi:hypothetical protein